MNQHVLISTAPETPGESAAGAQNLTEADHTTTNGDVQETDVGGDQGSESMHLWPYSIFQLPSFQPGRTPADFAAKPSSN
jgi:hypothetical protein